MKLRLFILGIVLGSIAAFPLGFNFGRNEPLLSNPFAKANLKDQVIERVKTGTEAAFDGARESLHEATRPLVKAD